MTKRKRPKVSQIKPQQEIAPATKEEIMTDDENKYWEDLAVEYLKYPGDSPTAFFVSKGIICSNRNFGFFRNAQQEKQALKKDIKREASVIEVEFREKHLAVASKMEDTLLAILAAGKVSCLTSNGMVVERSISPSDLVNLASAWKTIGSGAKMPWGESTEHTISNPIDELVKVIRNSNQPPTIDQDQIIVEVPADSEEGK